MVLQLRFGHLSAIATLGLALFLPGIAQAGLVGYWSLDGTLADGSGNDQHGTVGGTAGSFAEIYAADAPVQLGQGQSFEFNGATAIYLPFLDAYHTSHTTGTTVSMWIKAERQSDARLFGEGYTGSDRPFYAIEAQPGGSLRWYIRAWTNPPGTATQLLADTTAGVHLEASNPQWHHLLWTDEHVGGMQHELKVYVDGVYDKTFTYTWQDSTFDRTTLGAIHAGNIRSMMEGRMADVAVWNRVLGAAYIEDLAKGTRGPLPSTLFAEESFDYAAGPLSGNNGGLGWSGAWSGVQAVEQPGLEYTDSQGNQLITAGNAGKATSTTATYRNFDLRPDSLRGLPST